jgi:protein-tyrosine phosphatase
MAGKKSKKVVFVCTANFYRSRFAEHLFNALAEKRGIAWRATSRGFKTWMAENQGPISDLAVFRLTALGIPVDLKRFPIQLRQADLESADLVVAMKESEHRPMAAAQFPDWVDTIEYWHVDDLDCATADEALPVCQACVEALVDRLAAEEKKARLDSSHSRHRSPDRARATTG